MKIALPGIEHWDKINNFINFYLSNKEMFLDNFEIAAIYGNFQFCIWDGGRTFPYYKWESLEKINQVKNALENFNIPLRLVFTNPIVEEKHLNDRYCNLITEICESSLNEIVVNNPILEEYLRKSYPNYSFISSTTKCLNAENSHIEIINPDYKMVCLDYNLNKNKKFLEKININDRNKIEFLINAICPPGCPNRKLHYDLNGWAHLNLDKNYAINCKIAGPTSSIITRNYFNTISPKEIEEFYLPQGFNNFKLEGRTFSWVELLVNIVHYCVKEEHQHYIISVLS